MTKPSIQFRNLFTLAIALVAMLLLSAPAAQAGMFEIYAGQYWPSKEFDEDFTFGGRFGSMVGDKLGWQVGLGVFDVDDSTTIPGGPTNRLEVDLFLIDFSMVYYPGGGNFYFLGGPGWATVDSVFTIPGNNNDIEASDDVFTINAGLGYEWDVATNSYVKAEWRARIIDANAYDHDDYEVTFAWGWRFGGDAN